MSGVTKSPFGGLSMTFLGYWGHLVDSGVTELPFDGFSMVF